jgi:hypothetical protein
MKRPLRFAKNSRFVSGHRFSDAVTLLNQQRLQAPPLAISLFSSLLGLFYAQALSHFLVQEAFAGPVRLHPLAVNDELRDGAFTRLLDYFVSGSGRVFNIDFTERDFMALEKALGFPAVWTPEAGIDSYFHRDI